MVGIQLKFVDFYSFGTFIGKKEPPKFHLSGSALVHYAEAKPSIGKVPDRSPLRFQSGCRSLRWTGPVEPLVGFAC